jgi:sugar phosphate isomerase/epimerase
MVPGAVAGKGIPMFRVGMQMYSLREAAAEDLDGTFRTVAEIGYPGVQISGIKFDDPHVIVDVIKKYNLAPAGAHISAERFLNDLDGVIAEAKAIGYEDISIPSAPGDRRKTAADWERNARDFDRIGAQLRKEGIQLSYHNHAFEFEPIGDTNGFENLFANVDVENCQPEIDTYWAAYGGQDAEALLRRFAGHIRLVHAKDGKLGEGRPHFMEIGEGDLEWPPLLKACEEGGCNWLLVEQDTFDGGKPLESARLSFENLKKLLAG